MYICILSTKHEIACIIDIHARAQWMFKELYWHQSMEYVFYLLLHASLKHGKTNSYAINFDITTERRTDINSIISIFIMAKMHEMLNGLECPCEIKKSNDKFNETRSGRSSIVSIFRLLLFSLSTVIIIISAE